jgi:hypothetical protein
MLLYIIIPLASLIIGIPLCYGNKKIGKAVYLIITGSGLFFIAAFRYAVGYDYYLYANWFNSLRIMNENDMMLWAREKGFAFPAKILADAGFEYQVMFIIIAFVITFGIIWLIYRHSCAPWVSITAFLVSGLYFNSMNFMRQFIAAVLIAFALRYIEEKKFFRFSALVFLASAFHVSALLLLPFYFILKIKLNVPSLTIMLIGSMAVYIFITPLMTFITSYFYTLYDPLSNVEAASGLPPIYTIAFALFFILAFLLRKMLIKRNHHANTLLVSMYFAVFFSFLGTTHGILSRLALLFIVAPILILSADMYAVIRDLIFLTFKDSKKNLNTCAAFISFIFLLINGFYYSYLISESVNYNGVVPYQTVFEKQSDV